MADVSISKFQFEVSQSVTSSAGTTFAKGDTVEVQFLTKGTAYNGAFTEQYVDFFYASDDRDNPTWQHITAGQLGTPAYPKRFYTPSSYVTRSFVAGLNTDAVAIKMVITGSVTSSMAYSVPLAGNGARPKISLKYDDFTLKVHTPHSELTQDGILVWNSPSKYIRADKDGIDIKGGAVEVETLITDTLQVYGDVTAFGQMVTTNLEPYTDNATNISTAGSPGSSGEVRYAKGDHVHDLPFSTLDTISQEGTFTNITATKLDTTNISSSQNIGLTNHLIFDSKGNYFEAGGTETSPTLGLKRKSSTAVVTLGDNSTFTNITASSDISASGDGLFNNIGIGTPTPSYKLHFKDSSQYDIGFELTGEETFVLTHGTSGLYFKKGATLLAGVDQAHDFVVFDDTGTVYATFDGSTQRLGIGISSPSELLQLDGGDLSLKSNGAIRLENSNDNGNWWIRNGGTSQATLQLGTGDTPGSDIKITVEGDGKVGIGTGNPENELHVVGTGSFDFISSSAGALIEGSMGTYSANDGSERTIGLQVQHDVSASGFTGEYFEISSSTIISSASTSFGDDDSDEHHFTGSIATSGQVTINAPQYDSAGQLVTVGTGKNLVILQTTSNTSDAGIAFRNSGGAYSNLIYRSDTGGNDASLVFAGGLANGNPDSLTEHMTITTSGSVGIGTTTPATILEISDDIPVLRIAGTKDGTWAVNDIMGSLEFYSGDNSGTAADSVRAAISLVNESNTYGSTTGLSFATKTDVAGAPVERLRIDASGDVGIGTTTPTHPLTIEGAISGSGTIYFGGDLRTGAGVNKLILRADGSSTELHASGDSGIAFKDNADNTKMTMTDSGRFGIGTMNQSNSIDAEPVSLLHLHDNSISNSLPSYLLTLSGYNGDVSANPQGVGIMFLNRDTNSRASASIRMSVVNDDDYGDNDEQAGNLIFMTTNTNVPSDKMILTGEGNLGIGTLNPSSSIHAIGSISASTHLVAGGSVYAKDGAVLTGFAKFSTVASDPGDRSVVNIGRNGSATASLRIYSDAGYLDVGANNDSWAHYNTDRGRHYFSQPIAIDGTGDTYGYTLASYDDDLVLQRDHNDGTVNQIVLGDDSFKITLDATDRLNIDGSGNVGIGTDSPNHTLSVGSNMGGVITSDTAIAIGGAGDTALLLGEDSNNHIIQKWDASENSLEFHLTDNGTERSNALVIDNTGFIGIGTDSPVTQLHIRETATGTDNAGRTTPLEVLTLEAVNTAANEYNGFGSIINFRGHTYNNQTIRTLGHIKLRINDHSTSTRGSSLHFATHGSSDGSTVTEQMVLNDSGSLGIRVADPQETLDISGYMLTDTGVKAPKIQAAGSTGLGLYDDSGTSGIFVKDGGNIGIGTTNPSQLLTVSGGDAWIKPASAGGSSKLYLSSNQTDESQTIMYIEGDDTSGDLMRFQINRWTHQWIFTGGGNNYSPHNVFKIYGSDSATDDSAYFELYEPDGTVSTHIDSSGSSWVNYGSPIGDANFGFGIGTNSPSSRLHVYSSNDAPIRVESSDGTTGIKFKDNNGEEELHYRGNKNAFYINATPNTTKFGLGTNDPAFLLDVRGDAGFGGEVSSGSFNTSMITGYGWGFFQDDNNKWGLAVDNLTVRSQMTVNELLINQTRATNGSLWITSTGKVSSSVYTGAGTAYTLTFDEGEGSGHGHGFAANDLIKFQRWDNTSNSLLLSEMRVDSVSNTGSLEASVLNSTEPPAPGYEYVRIGNTSDANRQGSVYLTADDNNAPFIDVVDDVNSHTITDTNVKVRLGKLDGITSTTWGNLNGKYGLYSNDVYLEGGIQSTFGTIGGWAIGPNSITSSNITFDSSAQLITLASGIQLAGDGSGFVAAEMLKWSSGGNVTIGDETNENIYIANGDKILFRNNGTTYASLDASTWVLGQVTSNSENIRINTTDGIQMRTNTTVHSQLKGSTLTLGGADGDTSDCVVLDGSSVTIYGNDASTGVFITDNQIDIKSDGDADKITIDNSGMSITANSKVRANFGTTVTLGYTDDAYMTIASDALKMYDDDGAQQVELNSGTLTLGGANGTTADTVVIDGSSVTIYGNDANTGVFVTDNQIEIKSNADTDKLVLTDGGMEVKSGGLTRLTAYDSGVTAYGDAENTYAAVTSTGMSIVLAGVEKAQYGANATITGGTVTINGNNSTADQIILDSTGMTVKSNSVTRLTALDSGITMYGDASDTYTSIASDGMKVFLDGTERARIGSTIILAPDVSSPTDDSIQITAGGVTIYDNSNDYINISDAGLKVYESGAEKASFGANTTITAGTITLNGASTNDQLIINNSGVAIRSNNVLRSTFYDAGTTLYGDAVDTYSAITSAGMQVVLDGISRATFGASIVLAVDTASPTIDAIQIGDGGVTIYDSADDYIDITSQGLHVYESGTQKALFGANTTITGGTITLNGASTDDQVVISNDGMTVKSGGTDRLIANDSGIKAYGNDLNTFTAVNADGLTIVDNAAFVGYFNQTGITLQGGGSANDQLLLNNTGMTIKTNNVTRSLFEDSGVTIYGDATDTYAAMTSTGMSINLDGSEVAQYGADATINGGSITINAGGAVGIDQLLIDATGMYITTNGVVRSMFTDAGSTFYGDTADTYATIASNGMTIRLDGSDVARYGADTTITGGTITLQNSTNNNDKVVITEDSFKVYDNNTAVGSFGATTTIGDATSRHVEITSTSLKLKDSVTDFVTIDETGMTIVGSMNATTGEVGGWKIEKNRLHTGDAAQGMELNTNKGIRGVNNSRVDKLHSKQTFAGQFSFGAVVYSTGPGGGIGFDPTDDTGGTIQSMDGGDLQVGTTAE